MLKQIVVILVLTIFLTACSKIPSFGPQELKMFGGESAMVQEVFFNSNGFRIAGDLRIPVKGTTHPAIVLVHGSGSATRHGSVNFEPLIELFLQNGYAVFSWDKPGSGGSKGSFKEGHTLRQRSEILVDGIKTLTEHPDIDSKRIGLWGISKRDG